MEPVTFQEQDGNIPRGPVANLTVETPFFLNASSGPDGPIASYKWRIPEGAIRLRPLVQGGSAAEIRFEIVPIFSNETSIEEFAVLVVSANEQARVIWRYVDGPQAGISRLNLTQESMVELHPTFEAGFGSPSAQGLSVGDELVFIVAAKSPRPAPFGLLLSPVADRPGQPEEGATDSATLLDGREPVELPRFAQGSGLQVALYTLDNVFLPGNPGLIIHEETRSESMVVDDKRRQDTEPVATMRQTSITATFPAKGFSESFVFYFVGGLTPCPLLGTFDINATMHGTPAGYHNVFVTGVPVDVTGWASLQASAEGEGPAITSFTLDIDHACGFEFGLMRQFDLGATLETLTGARALPQSTTMPGLLGEFPPGLVTSHQAKLIRELACGIPPGIVRPRPAIGLAEPACRMPDGQGSP